MLHKDNIKIKRILSTNLGTQARQLLDNHPKMYPTNQCENIWDKQMTLEGNMVGKEGPGFKKILSTYHIDKK